MGAVSGTMSKNKCCGGCFQGLARRPMAVPDEAPRHLSRVTAVADEKKIRSMDEAMKLERPEQGSFVPSPQGSIQWASPAPRDASGFAVPAETAVEFDLEIAEMDKAQESKTATRLDQDIPAVRVCGAEDRKAEKRKELEAEVRLASPNNLPKPLTADQREAAIRSLLPTVTYQMLAKVDPELVRAQDANGQALRRKLVKGATIVFISAGLPGKRFVYERCAALGMKVVIIENADSWSKGLADEGIIAKFIPVDFSQSGEKVFADAVKHIRRLGKDGKTGAADGVATFVELSVPLVARIAEALGLPGNTPNAVDSARDKHQTRACLKRAGLPTPKNFLIKTEADIENAAKHVGFPCVLKPVCGAASLGVKKATSWDDLLTTYQDIVAELRTLVVTSGALVKAIDAPNGVTACDVIDLTILLEQYLDGKEVDVDIVMSEGEWRYAAIADNGPTLEPYFNETWAVAPSMLPKEQQYQLRDLAIATVKALGFNMGIFHVELKYTSSGPHLIECNARMGGGQIFETNLRCWGVDLVEETLFCALGIPCRPAVPRKPLTALAYCYVNAAKSGKAGNLEKLKEMAKRKNVVWAKPLVKPGQHVVGPEEGLPTWMADLLVIGETRHEALALLQALEAEEPVKAL